MSPTASPPLRERPAQKRPAPARPARQPHTAPPGRGGSRKRRGYRLHSSGRRLRLAAAAMAALFLLLAGRLVQLQGFQSHSYAKMAERQRTHTVTQTATRGEIRDRDGNVLAVDVDANDVYAQPPKISDAPGEAAKLAPVLHAAVNDLLVKLYSRDPFVYVARGVDTEVGQRVTALNLKGIGVLPQQKRLYPNGMLAANVLGAVGQDGTGLAGLESAYNTSLAGKSGTLVVEEDPQGRPIPSGAHREKAAVPGQGLQLTIDRDIQYYAEQTLSTQVRASGAIKGVAIVMNPHTGDIYAMASSPTFNPNNPGAAAAGGGLQNPAVEWTFEPGSVNKVVTVSSAIDRHVFTPTSEIDIPGSPSPGIPVGGFTIRDAESHGPERLTVAGVLAQSSNLGTLLISRHSSRESLENELRAFGLGTLTGVGLPGESAGLLAKSSSWSDAQAANIPFGQSMSVNALQVASAYSTIANGGVRVTPRVIAGTIDGSGALTPSAPGATRQVVTPQTATTMSQLLEEVTTENGTAPQANVPGYRVAGKTGTASRIDPKTGRYSGYVASFVGFAPADRPSLVVLVSLDNPKSSIFGGTVAAPVFAKIMSFALATMRVPPTGTAPVRFPLSVG